MVVVLLRKASFSCSSKSAFYPSLNERWQPVWKQVSLRAAGVGVAERACVKTANREEGEREREREREREARVRGRDICMCFE